MKLVFYFLLLLLFSGSFSFADETPSVKLTKVTPEQKILERIEGKLDQLSTPETFKEFANKNPNYFPVHLKTSEPTMIVDKDKLMIGDVTYSSYVGYRQVLIKGKPEILKAMWKMPELFQKAYALDGPSKVDGQFPKNHFKARVFKKVPAIEDQDYTLDYTITEKGPYTIIRAKLDHDKTDFALRDNLKVLEVTKDGLLVREISYLYPKKWYVHALGAIARNTMKTELNKISLIEKCLVEESKTYPPPDEIFTKCSK